MQFNRVYKPPRPKLQFTQIFYFRFVTLLQIKFKFLIVFLRPLCIYAFDVNLKILCQINIVCALPRWQDQSTTNTGRDDVSNFYYDIIRKVALIIITHRAVKTIIARWRALSSIMFWRNRSRSCHYAIMLPYRQLLIMMFNDRMTFKGDYMLTLLHNPKLSIGWDRHFTHTCLWQNSLKLLM